MKHVGWYGETALEQGAANVFCKSKSHIGYTSGCVGHIWCLLHLFPFFVHSLKIVKAILSLLAKQKQAVAQLWLMGCSAPTSALDAFSNRL